MQSPLSIVMLGATGAVGGIVARELARSPNVARLALLNRRPVEGLSGPRLVQHVVDVLDPKSYANLLPGHDCAICCLGVGQPSKVSREEFVRIDQTAVVDFAAACRAAGVNHFQLLGSIGANARSSQYYLRVKGESQDAITAMGFERTSFFQPSMILTPTNRYGLSQALLLALWPWVSKLLHGGLRKYRGIPVETLGRAIVRNAAAPGKGVEMLHWDQIAVLGRQAGPAG